MPNSMRPLLLGLLALALSAALAPAALARTGPCVPGTREPVCDVWTGKVTSVADGDTLDVDLRRDGRAGPVRLRVTGIQAMEQRVYSRTAAKRRGDCHALEATRRLEALVRAARGRVRVTAQDPDSRTGSRLRRSVAVRTRAGSWRDVGRVLLAEGHALWLPNGTEYAWNPRYSRLAERASRAGIGLWDVDACGAGPSPEIGVRLTANWDADGADGSNLNGEWVSLRNLNPSVDLPLGGWWVRDSHLRRYTFPPGATLPAGGSVRVHVGSGASHPGAFFWGLAAPAFENATDDVRGMGDGGYLFDPQGDLRAWMLYPCREGCTDPLQGALRVSARPRAREQVRVENAGPGPIDLAGYALESWPYGYVFEGDAVLAPGEAMVVEVRGDPSQDSRLRKHWGKSGSILDDRGEAVSVRTLTGIVVGCHAWGSAAC